ncbi:TPA: coiled-coil domain-containing protein [Campylobacter jejuni]
MADLEQVASDLNSASQSLQELREKYDGALDLLDNKNTEIIAELESAKSNALQEVQTASNTATSQISQLKDTSLNAVNEAKNIATSEISSKKDEALGEFSQATSEFNSTKEEALSQIEQAKAEQESSITELKESVSTQGQKITEIEENNTTQGEKITALEQAKENIITELNKKAKLLTENLTWTVGSGGDYTKLSEALSEACKYITISDTYTITVVLKSGYKLNEKIVLMNKLASHITIKSEDEQVGVDYDPLEDYLFTFIGCVVPQLSCLFNAEGTTAKGMYFLNSYAKMLALNTYKYKFGFINLKKNAVVVENSKVILTGYNLSENGKNLNTTINQDVIYCSNNAELFLSDCKLDNNGSLVNGWLYYCGYNSRFSIVNCSCLNNKSNYNILNNNNSYINAQGSNFTGSSGNYLLRSFNGAQTNLYGVNTTSCTWSNAELPFTANTVTKDGIIYK